MNPTQTHFIAGEEMSRKLIQEIEDSKNGIRRIPVEEYIAEATAGYIARKRNGQRIFQILTTPSAAERKHHQNGARFKDRVVDAGEGKEGASAREDTFWCLYLLDAPLPFSATPFLVQSSGPELRDAFAPELLSYIASAVFHEDHAQMGSYRVQVMQVSRWSEHSMSWSGLRHQEWPSLQRQWLLLVKGADTDSPLVSPLSHGGDVDSNDTLMLESLSTIARLPIGPLREALHRCLLSAEGDIRSGRPLTSGPGITLYPQHPPGRIAESALAVGVPSEIRFDLLPMLTKYL